MTEKVVIGDATLYHGDCMDVLPTLGKVDAVVTDPPYGINADKGSHKAGQTAIKQKARGSIGNKGGRGWIDYGLSEWDKERPSREPFDLFMNLSGLQIIWGGNYFTDYLPPTMQWLVWDKGQRNFSLSDCEFAWSSQKAASRIFDYPRALSLKDGKQHQTQKPIALMEWCIGKILKTTQTVLDPFMGSGTTGVACMNLGRKFIGIEIERKYFDIACERIEQAQRQVPLFGRDEPRDAYDQTQLDYA